MNKKISSIFTILSLSILIFVSCSDDDDFPAPVISNFEIGYDNSKIGFRGSDLHIDADIVAEGKIDRIIIEIHHEGDHHGHKSGQNGGHDDHAWEFEYTWTEFNGLLNTSFHKHIDIPADAELGDYHLHFKVIDMQGKVTEIEEEFEVKDSHDDDHNHNHDH